MAAPVTEPLLFLCEEDSGVLTLPFSGSTVCLYTSRSPDKDSCNEDAAVVVPCGDTAGALAVADGLGGVSNSEKASAAVVTELDRCIRAQEDPALIRDTLLNGIENANLEILAMGSGAATTVIAVEVNDGSIRSIHAGDSMAIVTGQRGKLKYQTISHSPVGYALESGFMEDDEAMTHDDRHYISNSVGYTDMRLELGPQLKLDPRDTLLLASDGLYDNMTIEEIIDIIRCGPLHRCGENLVSLCHDRMLNKTDSELCKPDDLTFILYRPA